MWTALASDARLLMLYIIAESWKFRSVASSIHLPLRRPRQLFVHLSQCLFQPLRARTTKNACGWLFLHERGKNYYLPAEIFSHERGCDRFHRGRHLLYSFVYRLLFDCPSRRFNISQQFRIIRSVEQGKKMDDERVIPPDEELKKRLFSSPSPDKTAREREVEPREEQSRGRGEKRKRKPRKAGFRLSVLAVMLFLLLCALALVVTLHPDDSWRQITWKKAQEGYN